METPNAKIKTSKRKKWLRRILITLSIIVVIPLTLFTIGWLNRDTVIDVLQNWYSENNSGSLTIGSVNANFLSEFPKVGFTLKDIKQTNNDTISDTYSSIQIDEAKLVIGAGNLLRGDIKFEKVVINNAIITSEVISERSVLYHEKQKRDKQNARQIGFRLPAWLHREELKFSLRDVTYTTKDTILHKYFNLKIHKVEGNYTGTNSKISGNTSMDITINNMAFNTKKGSFFNGARVNGNLKFNVDLEEHTIDIPEFPLYVDKQTFSLNANFELADSNNYRFEFQNPLTDFKAVKGLLPDSLAIKLKNYEIKHPLKTNLKMVGKFAYGNSPDIDAEFSTESNEIVIANKLHFTEASFSGYLTNDIYMTDSLRAAQKSRKDIKIAFNSINAELEDIQVDITNSYFQSTPDALNFVDAKINLNGNNETLAKIIETDNFDFKGGTFQLNAAISGDIPNPYQFLNSAIGRFKLDNTRVILKSNGLQLPIQSIDLVLEEEKSVLKQLIINLPNDENLVLKGTLNNISGLLTREQKSATTSQIFLDSKNLNINEIISLSKQFLPKSQPKINNRKTLNETLEAIFNRFHPQFNVNVESLQYNDVTINNVSSKIDLIDSETILLRNFDFDYFDVTTNLKGSVVVHGPKDILKDAVFIDAEAASNGSIKVFEELFDIELFRIDSGTFDFKGTLTGNIREFTELLNNAQGDLKLTNTKLHYEPADMGIEIDSLALLVNNSNIILEKFNLEIDDFYPINLNGNIKKFPAFLLDSENESGSIFLNVSSQFMDGDELITTISSLKNNDTSNGPTLKKALHLVFKDINKFNPKIELSIDSLKYKGLITEDVKALVYFENDSILKLNNLDLLYKQSTVHILGNVNSHTLQNNSSTTNPFDFDFSVYAEGQAEDLNDYLKTKNFIFTSGNYEFVGKYEGQSKNLKLFNSNTYGDLKIGKAIVDYKAAGLQIPVDSLSVEINNDVAELKALDIDLPGNSSIYFSGSIDNFSDFINDSKSDNGHSTDFSIYSPYIDTSDIEEFFEQTKSSKKQPADNEVNLQKFKDAMVKINNSFYPTVDVKIDTLRHSDFNVTNFKLDLLFDSNGDFKIEDTQLDFYGGSLAMTIEVGVEKKDNIPVSIEMQAKNIDIYELVTRFDYFNNDALREAEKIEGILNYTLQADGAFGNDGKLNMDSLNGTLLFELDSLELFNYKPIMEHTPLMEDERFQNLRFRPIVQTFEIRNGILIIPRTEIQSSAIHLFAEGTLKFNDHIDIWLSLPWSNLKVNDGLILPEKTSYTDAGSKFYVQLLQNKKSKRGKEQKLKVKIKLGDRKLKKQRMLKKE